MGQTVYASYNLLEGTLIDCIQKGYTPPVASQFYFTSTLQQCGGYNEKIKNGVDHDLWLTLAFRGVKIKSIDKYLSLPSEVIDVSRVKMTNSYQKRINGIKKSLEIWQPQLVAHFGESFFHKFREAYLVREKKKFFRMYILKLQLRGAFRMYREISEEIPTKEIIKSLFIALLLKLSIPVKREKYITRGSSLKIDLPMVNA